MEALFHFDKSFEKAPLIGVDEVGRGPLAGPLVVVALFFPQEVELSYLDDSKKLTEKQREIVSEELREQASYKIVSISPQEIDTLNILQATRRAMSEAVSALSLQDAFVLVDGNQEIDCKHAQKTLVKGDGRSAVIAAASIIAKVHRDRLMKDFDQTFPNYGFARHKGYATAFHREQIKKFGSCPIHRKSFLGNIYAEMNQLSLFS